MEIFYLLFLPLLALYKIMPSIFLYGGLFICAAGLVRKGWRSPHGTVFIALAILWCCVAAYSGYGYYKIWRLEGMLTQPNTEFTETFSPDVIELSYPEPTPEYEGRMRRAAIEPVCDSLCAEILTESGVKQVIVKIADGRQAAYRAAAAAECASLSADQRRLGGSSWGLLYRIIGRHYTNNANRYDSASDLFSAYGNCIISVPDPQKPDFRLTFINGATWGDSEYGWLVEAYKLEGERPIFLARTGDINIKRVSFPPIYTMACRQRPPSACGGSEIRLTSFSVPISSLDFSDMMKGLFSIKVDGVVGRDYALSDRDMQLFLDQKMREGDEGISSITKMLRAYLEQGKLHEAALVKLFESVNIATSQQTQADIYELASKVCRASWAQGATAHEVRAKARSLAKALFNPTIELLKLHMEDGVNRPLFGGIVKYLACLSAERDLISPYDIFLGEFFYKYRDLMHGSSYSTDTSKIFLATLSPAARQPFLDEFVRLSAPELSRSLELYKILTILTFMGPEANKQISPQLTALVAEGEWPIHSCAQAALDEAAFVDRAREDLKGTECYEAPQSSTDNCVKRYQERLRRLSQRSDVVNACQISRWNNRRQ